MLRERRADGTDVTLRAVEAALAAAVRRAQLHAHTHVTTGTRRETLRYDNLKTYSHDIRHSRLVKNVVGEITYVYTYAISHTNS